jgi:ketosteroid isomerase-like protein
LDHIHRPVLIVCAVALSACQPSSGDIRKALRDDEAQLNAEYKARDVPGVVSHYARDATLVTPGMTVVTEGQGIDNALGRLLANPTLELAFKADKVGVAASHDLAYARGKFTLTVTDPATRSPVTQTGNYLNVYRRQSGGEWKVIETIASLGTAPAS